MQGDGGLPMVLFHMANGGKLLGNSSQAQHGRCGIGFLKSTRLEGESDHLRATT